ncbi:MAG TPA: diguanylate cyclase [Woeseiaceae bacterium]|nr:diguanylate cyclase [Woeseiaceae bacterium]
MDWTGLVLPPIFAIAALSYVGLALFVSRSSPRSIIGVLLFLNGILIAGNAFTYVTSDLGLYGIGRTLTFFAASFMPVAFYSIYRQFTGSLPGPLLLALLSVIPVLTTLFALTDPLHNIIWDTVTTADNIGFTDLTEHFWFNRVHGPFAYGLFGYSVLALAAKMSSIASAHRRTVGILVACATLPFAVSVANNFLGFGPADFPFLSLTLVALLPLFAYASVALRMYDFSPVDYQTLFDHVRDPVIVLDNRERIICANRKATELLGKKESALLGQRLWQDVPAARDILGRATELDLTQTLSLDGNQSYEVSVAPLRDRRGVRQGAVVVCRDVTERRKALAQLADSEHLIRTLIETSSNGILRFALDPGREQPRFRCVFANRAAEAYLGEVGTSLVGTWLDALPVLDPERLTAHFCSTTNAGVPVSFEMAATVQEQESWLRIVGEPVGDDMSVTLIDITKRKHNEQRMLDEALRDPLTGVLNRRGFESAAASCIRSSAQGAVLYLDLNQFKSINDRFGHQAGDALLKAFGHRLGYCLRTEDILGRLGGDEFAIVLPGVSVADAKHIAERLVSTAADAYIIQGKEVRCSASVGIALLPQHGHELWHLISVADAAMYNAKNISDADAANDRAAYVDAATAEVRR